MSNPKSPQESTPHQGWVATLNSGEMAFEQPPIPGERTSWQKLLQHCRDTTFMKPVYEIVEKKKVQVGEEKTQLKLTSLRLQRGELNIHAMPQKMCDGYFQAYQHRQKSLFRPELGSIMAQGIGSIVGDQVFVIWINQLGQLYQEVWPLEAARKHIL